MLIMVSFRTVIDRKGRRCCGGCKIELRFSHLAEADGDLAAGQCHTSYQQIMHGQIVHCEQPLKVGVTGRPIVKFTSSCFSLIRS